MLLWQQNLASAAATITPAGIASAEAFGTPTVTAGAATVAPAGIGSAEAFGGAVIAAGGVTVAPDAIGSAEAFGAPVVAPGGVTVAPGGVPSDEAFGAPIVTNGAILPAGIASAEAFGAPSVTTGVAIIAPEGVATGEAFGAPRLSLVVAPTAIVSAEAFGAVVVAQGPAVVAPSGIPSAEAFGVPAVVADQVIVPVGIVSAELFGAPVVGRGALAQITELIDKFDNSEIVCEQIAAILVVESAHQQALAQVAGKNPELWRLRVFHERSNAWSEFIDAPDMGTRDSAPIVNVSYESSRFDMSKGNTVERQRASGTFHIDCYGYGVSSDVVTGGHVPGDELAATEVKRALRLVRNILQHGVYTYLGLRGTVARRWPDSITVFQPTFDGHQVQHVVGGRLSMTVEFNEFSPQVLGQVIELTTLQVTRDATGQVLLRADFAS